MTELANDRVIAHLRVARLTISEDDGATTSRKESAAVGTGSGMCATGDADGLSQRSSVCSGQGICTVDGAEVAGEPGGGSGQAGQSTASSAQATADAAAKVAKVQELISKAEAAYRSGVDNYRAGHLDTARLDFDSAVDLMLTSGMDLKTDPQLADEFDRLLNAVNSLEMAALKQGNGFSPTLEAAPLDAANEVTFPANAALTAKVTAELKTTQSDFPLVVNDYVAGFISYFSNSAAGHAHLLRSLERAGKYKEMISKTCAIRVYRRI